MVVDDIPDETDAFGLNDLAHVYFSSRREGAGDLLGRCWGRSGKSDDYFWGAINLKGYWQPGYTQRLMADYSLENYQRPKLQTPNGSKKILMHSCCAPCSGEVMDAMVASGIETTIFFYNPNIHPRSEY
jgi:hypothetical protein